METYQYAAVRSEDTGEVMGYGRRRMITPREAIAQWQALTEILLITERESMEEFFTKAIEETHKPVDEQPPSDQASIMVPKE